MQSRHGRRRKKSPAAVAGRRAGFGQTSLWRGRVGGGAVQEDQPDGMIGGALPPPAWRCRRWSGVRGRRDGRVSTGRDARATWPRLSWRCGRCSGARRCHVENQRAGSGVRFGQVHARPVRCRSSAGFGTGTLANMGWLRWPVQRVAWNGQGAPSPPSGYGATFPCLSFAICSNMRLCESRSRNGV